jgi:hypothetical protein
MWPTLTVGSFYRIWALGHSRGLRRAMLVGIEPDGRLDLALEPISPRSRWRPWGLARSEVRGVFAS